MIAKGTRGAICLINLIWTFTPRSLGFYASRLKRLKERGIRAIVLGSDPRDVFWLRLCGISCVYINQNQFLLEENIPVRGSNAAITYDAFYAAQAKPFKRMQLAAGIGRLYILTYGWPKELNAGRILAEFEPTVAHADYNRSYIDFEEVSVLMRQSVCALALSRKEGAMWAACEALLSGIPVVSTPSIGGRERYFDPRTVKMVRPNAPAVREAAEAFKRNPPDPEDVRRITLEKMNEDRQKTVQYFQEKLLKNECYSDAEVYRTLFSDGPGRTPILL